VSDLAHRHPAPLAAPFTLTLAFQFTDRPRLSVVLRPLYALAATIYTSFYLGLGYLGFMVAWVSILFTGRYPAEIHAYNVKVVRMLARYTSYLLIAHDVSPPLDGEPDATYPLQLELPPLRPAYDRRAAALRPLVAIPVVFACLFTYAIGLFHVFVGAIIILFTRVLPRSFAAPIRAAVTAVTRAHAHLLLMIDDPPAHPDA
jgi:hypothetical protein